MSNRTSQANRAVRLAWKNERRLVSEGKGTRDWTREQQKDILTDGVAKDENDVVFRGHHMQSVELFPQYQGEPENIQFLSKEEHLKAHDGSFRILTNWYYDPVNEKKEPFEDDKYRRCKKIYLSDPVCPPKPIVEENTESTDDNDVNKEESPKGEHKDTGKTTAEQTCPKQKGVPELPSAHVNADTLTEQNSDVFDDEFLDDDSDALMGFNYSEVLKPTSYDRDGRKKKRGFFERIGDKFEEVKDRIEEIKYEHPRFTGLLKGMGQGAKEFQRQYAYYKSMINDANNSHASNDNDRDELPSNAGPFDDDGESSPSPLGMMKKESFMKKVGYSTHLPEEERQRILMDLRKDHSRQEIEDRLNLNINLKKNSRKNYDDAIAAWKQDRDFVHEYNSED